VAFLITFATGKRIDTGRSMQAQREPLSDMDAAVVPESNLTDTSETQFSRIDHPSSESIIEHLRDKDKTMCQHSEVEVEGLDSRRAMKPQTTFFQRPLSAGDDGTHGFTFEKASKQPLNLVRTRKTLKEGPQVSSEQATSECTHSRGTSTLSSLSERECTLTVTLRSTNTS